MEYTLIRSKRKTIAIYVRGGVEVRAPLRTPKSEIDRFVASKATWIEKKLAEYAERSEQCERLDAESIEKYRKLAKRDLTGRALRFAKLMSVTPAAIKINGAKTRWGSCSAKKNINFSWRLIMTGDDVIDYVVVHELAHLTEMNHSKRFWAIVEGVLPDYRERRARLNEYKHLQL